jgi:hypothetical protein
MEWSCGYEEGFYVPHVMNHIKQFQSPQKALLLFAYVPSFAAWWVNNNEWIGLCHNRENVVSFFSISAWNSVGAFFRRKFFHSLLHPHRHRGTSKTQLLMPLQPFFSLSFLFSPSSIVNFRIENFCLSDERSRKHAKSLKRQTNFSS